MITQNFYSEIEPELCVGQEVTSPNEIMFIINKLAESTAQSPESPLQAQKRTDRKSHIHDWVGQLATNAKGEHDTAALEDETIAKLQSALLEAEKSPKREMGNYGVAALIIDKTTKKIVAAGKNSVSRPVYHGGELNARGDDGHAEVNALRAFYKKKSKALDAANGNQMKMVEVQEKFDPRNYELWTNLQPCHMCAGALRSCGMAAVYVAEDPVVVAYKTQYADAPGPGEKIDGLIHQIDDPARPALFGEKDVVDAQVRAEADTVFATTAEKVRARKTELGQQKNDAIDIISVFDQGSEHEKEIARRIISAIHAVSNEANESSNNIFAAFSELNHCEAGLVKNPTDNKLSSDSISKELELYLRDSAQSARENRNGYNAAIAIDPNGVAWFCTNDRTDTRNPLRTPIMRVLRRIEKVRAEAGEEIASHMPLPSDFTIVCLREPNDMEVGRLAASSVKNVLYLEPDREYGAVSTKQIEKMSDLYRKQRGLEAAVRPLQSLDISQEEFHWRTHAVSKNRAGGYRSAR